MARLHIDVRNGIVEAEGDEAFVATVYSDFKSGVMQQLGRAEPTQRLPLVDEVTEAPKPKQQRRSTRRSGPSCMSRIEALKDDKFFNELRTSNEIGAKLREKGTAYEGKRVAAALHNLTAARKLRRIQEDGVWKYQNP